MRQWTKLIGTSGTDWGQAVDVDSTGYIYVTGSVSGSFAGKTYNGGKDVFLAKYDSSGNRQWYQQWGTSTDNFGYGVKVDGAVVYVTGPTYEYLSGETGLLVPNIFLSKRSTTDGSESLTRILHGTPNLSDYVEGIALDGSGNIYLTGYTHGAFGGTNNGAYDVFLAKFDTSLDEQWTTVWGSTADDFGYAVAVDGSDIYVTGYTVGSFGGQTNAGGEDIFLTKITDAGAAGVVQWTNIFGTTVDDRAYSIAKDGNNIYLTGETFGVLDGANAGQNDVFLIQCDAAASGNPLWEKQLGTSAADIGIGVWFDDNDAYIYVTGNTSGSLDGNINAGGSDVFLLKYNSSGTKQ